MSIWWRRTFAVCVAVAALASCTDKTTGKPEVGTPNTATLKPDNKPDDSLIISDGVGCRYPVIVQLKLNGSTEGPGGNIIEVSRETDHIRIEWNGETTHALIVNDAAWVFVKDTGGVTLLYDKDWKDWVPIKKLVLCPREYS